MLSSNRQIIHKYNFSLKDEKPLVNKEKKNEKEENEDDEKDWF